MYVGRLHSHLPDVCNFYNFETRRMLSNRNMTWMGQVYGTWRNLPARQICIMPVHEPDTDDADEEYISPT